MSIPFYRKDVLIFTVESWPSMGQVASKWCSFLASTTSKRFTCCSVIIEWYLNHPRSMPSSLRQETKLLMIFSHQTQHFLHFLACCACANLFIHGMATDLMAKAEVSPTAILPIHSKIAAHLSATYWWTRLTMIRTAHYCSTGWKEEAAQPDPAKDFDFTLNMIAPQAIAA